MAYTMACPNFKKGLKMAFGPLGVNSLWIYPLVQWLLSMKWEGPVWKRSRGPCILGGKERSWSGNTVVWRHVGKKNNSKNKNQLFEKKFSKKVFCMVQREFWKIFPNFEICQIEFSYFKYYLAEKRWSYPQASVV
jgi:hypothetical protein